jgi:FdhE protein
LEKLSERIRWLKEKRPGYEEILDFYLKVREKQENTKASLRIGPILFHRDWKKASTEEGLPLLQRKDFPLDIEASFSLFQSLCQIGKDANPYMAEQVRNIESAQESNKIDFREILRKEAGGQEWEQIGDELGLDKKVLMLLIQNSIRPSIEAGMQQLLGELNTEAWLKGYCPVCGSLPHLSLLKEEVGKRLLLCSFCSCEWRINRLFCPFCSNTEQGSIHYFYEEGEESYHIDLCEKCHQYVKTIDLRKIEGTDPWLEDLATLHLDILASQRGYKRPILNPWIM